MALFYPQYLESTSNSFPPEFTEFPDRMPPSPVARTAEKAGFLRKGCNKNKGFLEMGGIPKPISFNTKIYEHCLMLLDDLGVPPWENLKEKVPRDTHLWGCSQVGAAWGCTRISKILVVIFETSDWVFIAYPAAPLVFMQLHAMLIHSQQEPFQKDREKSIWSICSWGLPKTMFLSMDWFQGKFTGKPEI